MGGGGEREGFFNFFPLFPMCSHEILIKFPQVSSCSPKMFPIAPRFHFHVVCPKFNSHGYKLKKGGA
jgi:hypothetical protein